MAIEADINATEFVVCTLCFLAAAKSLATKAG